MTTYENIRDAMRLESMDLDEKSVAEFSEYLAHCGPRTMTVLEIRHAASNFCQRIPSQPDPPEIDDEKAAPQTKEERPLFSEWEGDTKPVKLTEEILKKSMAFEEWYKVNKHKFDEQDPINPSHYQGKIEVIDFIEDKGLDFHLGNAVKYIARAGKKDPDKILEDLKKARWYLDRAIICRAVNEDAEDIADRLVDAMPESDDGAKMKAEHEAGY